MYPIIYIVTHHLQSAPLSLLPSMERYRRDGLIRIVSAMVSVNIPEKPEPLEDLPPGIIPDNFEQTAHILRHRFDGPRRAVKIALATRKASLLSWGWPGKLRASDADHDALLAAVYFSRPDCDLWRPGIDIEDEIGWQPDAVIMTDPMTIVEIGGSYTKEKLERRAEAAIEYRRILY